MQSTRRVTILCLFLLLAAEVSSHAATTQQPPSYKEVSRTLDELYRSSSSTGRMELISKTSTQTRTLKMRVWSKGKNKTLIVIDDPPREAGIATLKVDNNIWNYLPKISRTIRIPPSMMLSSWMGTDFTNDDLVKESQYEDEFDVAPGLESKEPPGWLYVMTVKPGIIGRWQKIDWVVRKDNLLPVQAKYYDRKGRLARIMYFSDVKLLGGKTIPTKLVLQPVDEPDRRTEIRYLDMTFDAKVPDSKFSLSELERK